MKMRDTLILTREERKWHCMKKLRSIRTNPPG